MKSDIDIQQDVVGQLRWSPFLRASDIGVTVKNGIVTLAGTVGSYSQKLEAEKAAKKVTGVRAIAEDIQIGVSPTNPKPDSEIAESVLNTLKWHTVIPQQNIQVKVEDGTVTLEGEVEWGYQRNSVSNAVASLSGVTAVNNSLVVKPKATVADVKAQITRALQRTATVDAEKITVDVNGTKVILHGLVRSFAEKEDAEEAAWNAPGITSIESYLSVEPQLEFTF